MAKTLIKVDKQTDLAASQYAEGVTAAIAAVQSDVDGNEADADAAIAAEAAAREAADTSETEAREAAITALQADVDQNESDADSAIAAVQADVDANEAAALAARNAIQADVDQNEADADAAIAAVASDLSEYEASNDAALEAETSRATEAEEANAAAIAAETARAEAAEEVLTTNVASLLANSDAEMADSLKEVVDGHNAAMTILKTVYAKKQIQTAQPNGSAVEFMFDAPLMSGSPVIMFNGVALEEGIDFSIIGEDSADGFTWLRGEEEEAEAPAAGERLMVYGIKATLAGIATLVAPE